MVTSKDELIAQIKSFIGEEPDDNGISLLENITDTVGNYETQLSDTTNWKEKYEENDRKWRKTYTERFNSPSIEDEKNDVYDDEREVTLMTSYDELFK